jgi:hypothetical protein
LMISRKLVKLKRVCECRGVDLNAFHDLWRSVDKRLTFLMLKVRNLFLMEMKRLTFQLVVYPETVSPRLFLN